MHCREISVCRVVLWAALSCWLLGGCVAGDGADSTAAQREPAELPVFVDIAAASGIDRVPARGDDQKEHLPETMGGGVAIADYDADGDLDLYFTTAQTRQDWIAGRSPEANALYRNNGDGSFVEVAETAGVALAAWSNGAHFVDYDADGDPDLFVTAHGPNVLYRNEGDGTFRDVTQTAGVAGPEDAWSASAAFADLDGDGDLDLYVTNYCEYDLADPPFGGEKTIWRGVAVMRGPRSLTAQHDTLYRNNGDGTFSDISREAGIHDVLPQYALGVVVADLDGDSDADIYVANDSMSNVLWRNEGELRFTDVGTMAGVATNEDAYEQAGMGADAADYDGDGLIDLVVTNFSHDWYTLYHNQGELSFIDATYQAGLNQTYLALGWGAKFFDYDNDGLLDLLLANGHVYPGVDDHPALSTRFKQPNQLYRNVGSGILEDRSVESGPGLAISESSRGLALADLDRDGDLDAVVTHIGASPSLLRNDGGNRNSWIAVRLVGERSNRDGIGATLELTAGGQQQTREVNPFGSYLSQGTYVVHFGLGRASRVKRLRVTWPSGETDELDDLETNRFYTIGEGTGVTAVEEPAS